VAGLTPEGNVVLINPWGHTHPRPVRVDDFQKLFKMLDVWP